MANVCKDQLKKKKKRAQSDTFLFGAMIVFIVAFLHANDNLIVIHV